MKGVPLMAKEKALFACTACGFETAKWTGKCPGCGAWNTMEEATRFIAPAADGRVIMDFSGKDLIQSEPSCPPSTAGWRRCSCATSPRT